MKRNNKTFPLLTLLIILAVIYIIFAVKPIKNAMQLIPQWTIDITNPQVEPSSTEKLFPFKLGNNMGYYTSDGEITLLQPFEQKSTISSSFWAEFPANATQTPFFTMNGTQSGVLQRAGFPFFDENKIFLFHPGGNSFSAHDANGSEIWSYEDYAPIISFSSTVAGSIAGFADGKLVAFDPDGKIIHKFYPNGSEYEIIFGAALSENGEYTACLSGLDSQRIVISHIGETQSKVVFHEYLQNDLYEQTLVQFSSDNQYAFFGAKDELIIVDINKKESIKIPIKGKILTITEVTEEPIYFILSKEQNKYTVTIVKKGGQKIGDFSFAGNSAFLYSDTDNVYIGCDTRISKIKVGQ